MRSRSKGSNHACLRQSNVTGPTGNDQLSADTLLPHTTAYAAPSSESPELVWASLAPVIAATRSMRLIDPETNSGRRGRALSKRLPALPAAVPIYNPKTRTTRLLVFDFDPKDLGPAAVAQDADRLASWLRECGGRWISDHNVAGGGRHIIVALARGEAFHKEAIEPLMRLLKRLLPTLDIAPMMNPTRGAITPPGSATRAGGHRVLDGTIAEALAVFTQRSAPGLVAHLRAFLGDTIQPAAARRGCTTEPRGQLATDMWEGSGESVRLREAWRLRSPIPEIPAAFAAVGAMPADGRWLSPSEARQSVLYHSALRGLRLTDVQDRMRATDDTAWAGLNAAYARYRDSTQAATSLAADWAKACHHAAANIEFLRSPGHREGVPHTPPSPLGEESRRQPRDTVHTRWLASATAWVHLTWPGSPYRWTVLAVLQALSYGAYVTGEIGPDGTPLVEAGIRAYALFGGCMPETTVADVLADIRDIPGSPIHRVRRGAGTLADRYSLVTARRGDDLRLVDPVPLERIAPGQVHDAWRVLGLHCRAVYELIQAGITRPADLAAAAHISARTAYDVLASLAHAGLITRSRGAVALGAVTLDDIAAAHGLPAARAERLVRYQRERVEWRAWLDMRHGLADITTPPAAPWDTDRDLSEAIWAAQMASGAPDRDFPYPEDPDIGPERDDDAVALALLRDQLGAVLLA